jgi:hypothetical protein
MTKADHSACQGYQDAPEHPDLSLYDVFLTYGAPIPEPAPAPPAEADQPGLECEISPLFAPHSDKALEDLTLNGFSEPLVDYAHQPGISYDQDLAFTPDIDPAPPPSPESDQDEDERFQLEIGASKLVMEIGSISMSRSTELHSRILSVLQEFPHPASVEAIRRALLAGHTVEDIVDACTLKMLWRDSSELWLTRSYVRREGMVIFTSENMRNSLTWVSALRLIDDHGLVRAETGMTSEWVEGWISLEPPGREAAPDVKNEYYAYLDYALGRADAVSMRDPDEWPYQSLFDHDPQADPLVRSRVIPAAFHQYETGGTRDRPGAVQSVDTRDPSENGETGTSDESGEDELARQIEIEDMLMMVAIRGKL